MPIKALFLDRDGVINVDYGHVHRPEQITFVDGIFDLCASARRAGFHIIVVTNQAAVARGRCTEQQVCELHEWLKARFAERGIPILAVYYCPYHPEADICEYRTDSFDRKPKPGMLLRAKAELDVDMAASVLVGDNMSDIEAGRGAGVASLILFRPTEGETLRIADFGFRTGSLFAIAQWLASR